jgi:ankyrin repeat protein
VQYVVYNTILRSFPEDLFQKFKKFDNLFPTTIFALASAVQKVSRVMKLPENLILYRGLGGTTDLPDSYFQLDQYGCSGFVEWGFMSTTASKKIAIDYCGLSKQKPLPLVLAVRVGAADRGACIREFSQYMGEVEYLFAPCSLLEPDGPDYLEVTAAGVVRVFPVSVSANQKSSTIDELVLKKKTLHLSSFKYRIHEIELRLQNMADEKNAIQRLDEDVSRDEKLHTVASFLNRIVKQCEGVYSRHEAVSANDYNKDNKFRSLVLEMIDVKDMAIAKLTEWLENKGCSYIRYRFHAELRTAHRRCMAFLERRLLESSKDDKSSDSLELLKNRSIIIESVDEENELGENRLMTAAAEGQPLKVLQLLVDASANVNCSRKKDAVTPMWLAAQFGHCETVQGLIKLNAAINQCATDGASPLYIAAQCGNCECIAKLAENRADVNLADKVGLSPAHQAAMNGHTDCLKQLMDLGADLDGKDTNGSMPYDLALHNKHEDCAKALLDLVGGEQPFQRTESSGGASKALKKLIISTGDVSDVDGFMALSEYAKTGSDVLFIMNYPAYVGVAEDKIDESYAEENPGLGYKYSAKEVLESVKLPNPLPEYYTNVLSRYKGQSYNDTMKCALTDLAFAMANKVWNEASTKRGALYFVIGGINSVNPFSPTAIKNEILIYSDLIDLSSPLKTDQGLMYDASSELVQVDWESYSDIYMDFNGSLAFWNESWENKLSEPAVVEKIRGVFIMGGVYADQEPITSPPIPNILNRFSSATMNQLYHPYCTAAFFAFLANCKIPSFVITNNVVKDMSTMDSEQKIKTFSGVEQFLISNDLKGASLQDFCEAHYTSIYNPPRKPFDFFSAKALTVWLESEQKETRLKLRERSLFYSNVYGMTYVSLEDSWEKTRDCYIGSINTKENDKDPPDVKNKKEYFVREINVLKQIQFFGKLPVYDICFAWEASNFHLDIDYEPGQP